MNVPARLLHALRIAAVVSVAAAAAACGVAVPASRAPSTDPGSSAVPVASPIGSAEPTGSRRSVGPIASSGSIAILGIDGSLSVVDAGGRSTVLSAALGGAFGFPTWSPDGTRIAAVRSGGSGTSIVVFDAAGDPSEPIEPLVIFEDPSIAPFYLFWTPDGRAVSFLASEGGGLSLRLAPADRSGPSALVRTGSPFYYDWIGQDRLLAHIGLGSDAYLGEIGLDGKPAAPAIGMSGDFRSAVVSHDQGYIAFVRRDEANADQLVIAARDGSSEQVVDVFGTAALLFDPAGDTVASIAPIEAQPAASLPFGPLRLLDPRTGAVRTLIEGLVVSFWWSPDGGTIAALRVQPVAGEASPPANPTPSPTAAPTEVRLLFVDVAGGRVRSQPVVQPGPAFVEQLFPFFDQYALSHRMWAPDGTSLLMPEVDPDGTTHVTVRFPDGEPPIDLDGAIGFWSP